MNKIIKQAFTLIELLVVIAIIGILSGLIVVSMSGVTQKATMAKAQVFSNSLRSSMMMEMIAEWKFDNLSGTVEQEISITANFVTDSWETNHGTAGGSPTLKNGNNCISGNCLSFNGSTDFIGGSLSGISSAKRWAIAAWIKTTDADAQIIDTRTANVNGAIIYTTAASTLYGYVCSTSDLKIYIYNVPINNNVWHHVVWQRNGDNEVSLYFDGTLATPSGKTTDANISTYSETWSTFSLGSRHSHDSYFYNGLLDDVRIFNAAIPTSQIKEQYYAGLNRLLANGSISIEEYNQRIKGISLNK